MMLNSFRKIYLHIWKFIVGHQKSTQHLTIVWNFCENKWQGAWGVQTVKPPTLDSGIGPEILPLVRALPSAGILLETLCVSLPSLVCALPLSKKKKRQWRTLHLHSY